MSSGRLRGRAAYEAQLLQQQQGGQLPQGGGPQMQGGGQQQAVAGQGAARLQRQEQAPKKAVKPQTFSVHVPDARALRSVEFKYPETPSGPVYIKSVTEVDDNDRETWARQKNLQADDEIVEVYHREKVNDCDQEELKELLSDLPANIMIRRVEQDNTVSNFTVEAGEGENIWGCFKIAARRPGQPVKIMEVIEDSWAGDADVDLYDGDEIVEVHPKMIVKDVSRGQFEKKLSDLPQHFLIRRLEWGPADPLAAKPAIKLWDTRKVNLMVPPLVRNRLAQSWFKKTVEKTEPPVTIGIKAHPLPPERPFIASFTQEQSWAEAVGLQVGDEIIKLEGQDVTTMTEKQFRYHLKDVRPLRMVLGRLGMAPDAGLISAELARRGAHPERQRDYQTRFTATTGPLLGTMGLTCLPLPPGRMFVTRLEHGKWASSVGVQMDDELLQIEGVDTLTMSEKHYRAFMKDVRPLRLTFGRLGLVRQAPGIEVDYKSITLPAGMLADPPVSEETRGVLAVKALDLSRQAMTARHHYKTTTASAEASIGLVERYKDLQVTWGEYHFKNKQPFPGELGARANIQASAAALLSQTDAGALDDEVDEVLADLWNAVSDSKVSDEAFDSHFPGRRHQTPVRAPPPPAQVVMATKQALPGTPATTVPALPASGTPGMLEPSSFGQPAQIASVNVAGAVARPSPNVGVPTVATAEASRGIPSTFGVEPASGLPRSVLHAQELHVHSGHGQLQGATSPLSWVSPLQGATWGVASATPHVQTPVAPVGSPQHNVMQPAAGQQHAVPRFGAYAGAAQHGPGGSESAAQQGNLSPTAQWATTTQPMVNASVANQQAHAADAERRRQLDESVKVATKKQEMDVFLQDLDRMEGWVQSWVDQEEKREYLAGNHEVREDSFHRADALKMISSQLHVARPDAVPGEAAGTGGTPMTGGQGGLMPPKWNNPKAAVPSNFTFDAELRRLQMEVEAIRGKTRKDLGLNSDSVFFV